MPAAAIIATIISMSALTPPQTMTKLIKSPPDLIAAKRQINGRQHHDRMRQGAAGRL